MEPKRERDRKRSSHAQTFEKERDLVEKGRIERDDQKCTKPFQ
jgi:hypothetical protein